jgi:hypothetical protein
MPGVLLIFGSNAKADEIRVTAYAEFQQPNAESSNQLVYGVPPNVSVTFGPDVLVPVAGELSVGAVPEPETGILLVFSVLVAPLFVAKAKLFRPLRS